MATGWFWIQIAFAGVGGFLGWFLGGADGFLYTLLAFISVDYITGLMCAVHDRKLSSKVGWSGIFRKVSIILLVGVGALIDRYVLGHDHIMRTAIIFFYLSNEGISILENAVLLGLPVPESLRDMLSQLRERGKPTYKGKNFDGLEDRDDDHI